MRVKFYETSGDDADDIGYFYDKDEDTKIRAYHYPFCCTGLVLAKLGGSENAFTTHDASQSKVKAVIEEWIEVWTTGEHADQKKQFISVCTTDEQDEANKALEELGFKRGEWIENGKYGGAITTWMLAIGHLNKYEGED